jgi:hypothetical protein
MFLVAEKLEKPFYRKSCLKAHGFNRGMKGGVARHPLFGDGKSNQFAG